MISNTVCVLCVITAISYVDIEIVDISGMIVHIQHEQKSMDKGAFIHFHFQIEGTIKYVVYT